MLPANLATPQFRKIANRALLVVLVGSGMLIVFLFFHGARIRFQRSISVGMSPEEVIGRAGPPMQIIKPGETINTWGSSPKAIAKQETWLYYVFPESQHRFVVTFSDGVVTAVQHQQN
jgi:hypothetical protein